MSYRNRPLYQHQPSSDQDGDASTSREKDGKHQLELLLDILSRRKRLIVAVISIGMFFLAVYFWQSWPEPRYQATSYVMADLSTGRASGATGVAGRPSDDFFAQGDRTLNDELFILRTSTTLATRVAERLVEAVQNADTNHHTPGAPRWEEYHVDQIAALVRNRMAFQPLPRSTRILTIAASASNPAEAALMANLFAEEYVRHTGQAGIDRVSGSLEYFEDQVHTWRDNISQIEKDIQAHIAENSLSRLDQGGNITLAKIADFEARRDDAKMELEMRLASLKEIEAEIENLSPRVAEGMVSDLDRKINDARNRIIELEINREQIVTQYPAGQRGQFVVNQLASIEQEIERRNAEALELSRQYLDERMSLGSMSREATTYLGERRRDATRERTATGVLQARIWVTEARLKEAYEELSTIPVQSEQLAQLERSRMHAERMHDLVMSRMLEARLQSDANRPGYVRLIERAYPPSRPIATNVQRDITLSLLLLFGFAIGLAIVFDRLDNRIYKPEALEARGYKSLAIVPNMRRLIKDEFHGKEFIEAAGTKISTMLVTVHSPMTPAAESYRYLRNQIQFSRPDRVVQTVLVTSGSIGEGKSITAANVAIVMAQAGRKTLLIDCDPYRPTMHQLFGLDASLGLVQVLEGAVASQTAVKSTAVDDLWVLPAGEVGPNPGDIMASARLREIMNSFRQEFDAIIIDTPPVRAMSGSAALATQSDVTIMVARAGQTKEAELDLARSILKDVGVSLIGVVFNAFDVSMAYGYRYRYSNYGVYSGHSAKGYYENAKIASKG